MPETPYGLLDTPESIKHLSSGFNNDAWKEYTPLELGQWVSLFIKRSKHRTDRAKAMKDITDAKNYLDMLASHVSAAEKYINDMYGDGS